MRTFADVRKDWEKMEQFPCKPLYRKKVHPNHVFDEPQSVLWNREMAKENNDCYDREVKALVTQKHKTRDALLDEIYTIIQNEVGNGLSKKGARAIWDMAWKNGHASGFVEVESCVDELVDLAKTILSSRDNG